MDYYIEQRQGRLGYIEVKDIAQNGKPWRPTDEEVLIAHFEVTARWISFTYDRKTGNYWVAAVLYHDKGCETFGPFTTTRAAVNCYNDCYTVIS